MQTNKLFIGGISWNLNSQDLQDAFAEFGEVVSAHIVTDRETGRSRGFGFVEFTSVEEAVAAQAEMDGKELDGRAVKVDFAQDKR